VQSPAQGKEAARIIGLTVAGISMLAQGSGGSKPSTSCSKFNRHMWETDITPYTRVARRPVDLIPILLQHLQSFVNITQRVYGEMPEMALSRRQRIVAVQFIRQFHIGNGPSVLPRGT